VFLRLGLAGQCSDLRQMMGAHPVGVLQIVLSRSLYRWQAYFDGFAVFRFGA
jgi:hypothetical protein